MLADHLPVLNLCLFEYSRDSRCSDANLIDIPVQVETPDRHYYHVWVGLLSMSMLTHTYTHCNYTPCERASLSTFFVRLQLAFFTTRRVNAFEELSWVSERLPTVICLL